MEFMKNLAAHVKVKTLVTFAVIAVFAALAMKGEITPDNVTVIVVEIAQAEENDSAPETERRVPAEQSEIKNLKGKRMRTKLMMGLMLAAQLYTLMEIVDLLLFVM